MELYNKYSDALKNKYGQKVYKLPINMPVTCPNRDGLISDCGCIFCGDKGAGYESLPQDMSVREQLECNMSYIGKKYNANSFIAYFQNFTNTYIPLNIFKAGVEQAVMENIVQIDVSTRPDCVAVPYLEILKDIKFKTGINIGIELGLQTANYHTLNAIGRGHDLAQFIDAAILIKNYGFELCVHVILDLPYDSIYDVIETAKIISALSVDSVKLHSLYVVKGTRLEAMLNAGETVLLPIDEYIERAITFLEYLNPNISIQRIIGRAPKEDTVMVNNNISWWKVKDEIESKMNIQNRYQGMYFSYLGGERVRRFL